MILELNLNFLITSICLLAVLVSILFLKREHKILKKDGEEFKEFWKQAHKTEDLTYEEKRLAALSHCYRGLKRSLERGEEISINRLRNLIRDSKGMSRDITNERLSNLYRAGWKKLEGLKELVETG